MSSGFFAHLHYPLSLTFASGLYQQMLLCNHRVSHYPGAQVSMCIIGVHYTHIRGSCLSHIHLQAPPTLRACLYANANDLCLIYPAVCHLFFSHYHQKRSSRSKTTPAIFVIPLPPPPPLTS